MASRRKAIQFLAVAVLVLGIVGVIAAYVLVGKNVHDTYAMYEAAARLRVYEGYIPPGHKKYSSGLLMIETLDRKVCVDTAWREDHRKPALIMLKTTKKFRYEFLSTRQIRRLEEESRDFLGS